MSLELNYLNQMQCEKICKYSKLAGNKEILRRLLELLNTLNLVLTSLNND